MLAKAEELKIFEAAIKKLGKDSYLGPMLMSLLPHLENDMRSDIEPDLKGYIEYHEREKARLEADIKAAMEKLKGIDGMISSKQNQLGRILHEISAAKLTAEKMADEMRSRMHWLTDCAKAA